MISEAETSLGFWFSFTKQTQEGSNHLSLRFPLLLALGSYWREGGLL